MPSVREEALQFRSELDDCTSRSEPRAFVSCGVRCGSRVCDVLEDDEGHEVDRDSAEESTRWVGRLAG